MKLIYRSPPQLVHGYRAFAVRYDNGFRTTIFEHREVMEAHLGRRLRRDEVVHHKDENKLNNVIDNLEVMSPSEHASHHALLPELMSVTCPQCNEEFVKLAREERARIKKGRSGPYCGKSCAGKSSRGGGGRRSCNGRLRCSRCSSWMEPSAFSSAVGKPGGRDYECRACRSERRKNKPQ